MLDHSKRFAKDEAGSSSIERFLVAAGILIGISIAMAPHWSQLKTAFAKVFSSTVGR
jgi:Flp pilus assembly pilin Flp